MGEVERSGEQVQYRFRGRSGVLSRDVCRAAWEGIIDTGTRVRLKPEFFSYSRPHLLYHARQGDIGAVALPSKQSPAMARLYTIVHFEQCGHDHRLLNEELEPAGEEQSRSQNG